ncbi:MAG: DegV family protein [Clostridia bacterium]|nr:DegV family protein [Clostridia bacterium]
MKRNILIASDSTSDLSPALIERYGIRILPLGVTVGDKHYTDGVDIDPDFIYKNYAETKTLPKTSAISIGEATDFFKACREEADAVIFFTISSQMSSTFHNVRLAAQEFEAVYVVDTQNLSTGGGLLVLKAAEMAEAGAAAEEIVKTCEALVPCVDASFVIDSLEFLHKGGRCSAVAAFGANLLQLKPCIVVKNGKMGVSKKYRGKFGEVLKKYVAEQIGDASDIDLDRIFVTHAGCDEAIVSACVALVKELAPFKNVEITRAGCTISSHCGQNTLGVLFFRTHPIVQEQ